MTFVGVTPLLYKTCRQTRLFEEWAGTGTWHRFGPAEHFDWWAFPIARDSNAYGDRYNVAPALDLLRNNRRFLEAVLANASLLSLGWGWDLVRGEKIADRAHPYGIRISKCGESLGLWQMPRAHAAFLEFTRNLFATGFVTERTVDRVTVSRPHETNPLTVDLSA
jgi:hypothetical protein